MAWFKWMQSSAKAVKSFVVSAAAALRGNQPGGWASDHRSETERFTGWHYIAIHGLAMQAMQADVSVYADANQPAQKTRRKSLRAKYGTLKAWKALYGQQDEETDPLPSDHPLVKLLAKPNPAETGGLFRYRQIQQLRLTGTCLVWNVPSQGGGIAERYVIPIAATSPVPPSHDLPRGGWRLLPTASRYMATFDDGFVEMGASWMRAMGKVIPAEQMQVIRWPHPIYLDDGQSPLAAGALWSDAADMVDEARFHQLRNGATPSLLVSPAKDTDPSEAELERASQRLNERLSGAKNTGKAAVMSPGATITSIGTSPKDMAYDLGWEQLKAANLAIHQTPPIAVGIEQASAYVGLYAPLKQYVRLTVQPHLDMLAESDTEVLAPLYGQGLTVEIEAASVEDDEMVERQLANDLAARTITRNEWRAVRGRPPLPGPEGDELVGQNGAPAAEPSPGQPVGYPNPLASLFSPATNGKHSNGRATKSHGSDCRNGCTDHHFAGYP